MQDDRPRRRNGRHGNGDETRANLPGMDSGFFNRGGFDEELDPNAFENTALNKLDPIREKELFDEFEQDYRSGGYDPGPERGSTRYHPAYENPDPRHDRDSRQGTDSRHGDSGRGQDSGYREGTGYRQDSGYREDTGYREDSGYREDTGYREQPDRRAGDRPRHGKSHDRRKPAEGPARIPLFARKTKPAPTRGPAPRPQSRSSARPQLPFGDLTPYLVPIMAAVLVVMVLVVLLLNR